MSEAAEGQYAGGTMPDVTLHYDCTMIEPGKGPQCREGARYVVRGHNCANKRSGEGKLRASCQAHLDEWQALEYPVRCGVCNHAFNGPLDVIWEVHQL